MCSEWGTIFDEYKLGTIFGNMHYFKAISQLCAYSSSLFSEGNKMHLIFSALFYSSFLC